MVTEFQFDNPDNAQLSAYKQRWSGNKWVDGPISLLHTLTAQNKKRPNGVIFHSFAVMDLLLDTVVQSVNARSLLCVYVLAVLQYGVNEAYCCTASSST